MARYALIDDAGAIVRVRDEARIDLTAGMRDGYSWRVVENVTVDNSTLPAQFTKRATVETIEANRVLRTTTVLDMTQAEIDAVKAAVVDGFAAENAGKALLSVYRVLYGMARQINPSVTPQQFRTFVNNATAADDIPAAAFKAWLAGQFE
jgi:hypothetical protein